MRSSHQCRCNEQKFSQCAHCAERTILVIVGVKPKGIVDSRITTCVDGVVGLIPAVIAAQQACGSVAVVGVPSEAMHGMQRYADN